MPHRYWFSDDKKTLVIRDDGQTFPWDATKTPGEIGHAMGGRAGEDYRLDGCPMPEPHYAKRPTAVANAAEEVTPKEVRPKKRRKSKNGRKTKKPKSWPMPTARKGRAKKARKVRAKK